MATKAEIIQDSNSTYIPNSSGLITPQTVQTLNTEWINASIFPEDTGSMSVRSAATASFLLGNVASASFSAFAVSASQANSASTSLFANNAANATSASYALTASFALNVPATASFAITSSFAESSSFAQSALSSSFASNANTANSATSASFASNANTANTATSSSFASNSNTANSATSASYSVTSSLATRNILTASAAANILTFTKGDGTTFNVSIAQSGSVQSASFADNANTANSATSASYAFTASSATNSFSAISASFATSASRAISAASATSATSATSALTSISASQATNANNALTSISSSFATFAATAGTAAITTGGATLSGNNVFSGVNTFNNAVTMSNVQINGTASIQYLDVVFQSSSIIYSSGSNQFGDASNDTQTLWGTVNVISGPLVVTGSANFASVITGSISTALNANTATSASFATVAANANTASFLAVAFVSASQVGGNDKVSLTNMSGTTTTLTIDNVANANSANTANTATSASFATTAGTANIASSVSALNQTVTITGSVNVSGSIRISQGDDLITHHVQAAAVNGVEIQNNTGNVVAQFGAGGGLGTTFNGQVNATAFSGSGALVYGVVSSSYAFTASSAVNSLSSSYALSASFARNSLTASYFDGLVASASYALVAETANNALTANVANSALSATSASFADTAGTANTATSASYAYTASSAVRSLSASYAVSASFANTAATASYAAGYATLFSNTFDGDQTINTGYILTTDTINGGASGNLNITATGLNALRLSTENEYPIILSGSTQITGSLNAQAISSSFSGSGAQIFGVVSSSFALTASYLDGAVSAFPFTGSAGISGSLNLVGALNIPSGSLDITGSAIINSGSLILYSYKLSGGSNRPFEALVTQSLNSTNNIISITANSANTGSIVISGSGNYVSLSSFALNTQNSQGATSGFSGTNAYVTLLPITTGSNPNYNTTADRNNRRVPQITNSNVNGTITINDNRASESNIPFSVSNGSANMSANITLHSGSLAVSNSQLLGTGTTFLVSGSGTLSTNASIQNSILSTQSATVISFNATGSGAASINNSILVGANLRVNITGSSSQNSTTTTTPAINDSVIIGRYLIVTGSSSSGTQTANIAVFGAHNTADGLLNDGRFTKFAIGTGTADATRSTAFHVSASGMTTVNAGLNVRGNETGSTELEVRATGVKIGNLLADSHNLTGSFSITGSQTITGSLVGQPISQSVSSNTASLDLATGNFFNLTLPASTNTYITASGQIPGQTINLKITQQATTGSVTIGAGIKQVSGSAYTVTATANAVDIVTFISFDETGLYLSNVKNLV